MTYQNIPNFIIFLVLAKNDSKLIVRKQTLETNLLLTQTGSWNFDGNEI